MRVATVAFLFAACVSRPSAQAALSYTVEAGNWPNAAHRDAAIAAIQTVVNRYNAYGDFGNNNVYVYYNAGIPTAQANYNGSIGFGGTYPNERVMAHEMAHYRGLPSGNWGNLMVNGTWTGALGLAKVRQLEGEQAVINGDGAHFWPYGLNYDNEGSELNKQRQVELVYAMRGDLGIGPTSHPGSNRLVTLTADNPVGESGFNFRNQWSDGHTPHSTASYSTGDHLLRTPNSSNSYKFYGGPLIIENADGAAGGLAFNGSGTTAITTINDLRLEGGWVQHLSSAGSLFQLDGNVNVLENSVIRAKQGNINLLADVTGAADLTIETTDSPAQNDRYVRFLSPNNTFTGDIINKSRFELAASANFRFAVGANGTSNTITGPSALATILNGEFDLNLSAATNNAGDSWSLVNAANTTYGSSFKVNGFNNLGGTWSNGSYSFSQSTGLLTLVPAWNVNGGGLWSTASNWSGGVPVAGGEATFGAVLTAPNAPATVNVDTPVSLSLITFDNANQYDLAGPNAITLTGGARVLVKNGTHKISAPIAGTAGLNLTGPGTLELTAASTYTGDTNIQSGTLKLSGGAALAGTSNIHVHQSASLHTAALASGFALASGQTLNNNGSVTGNVIATSGATIAGRGTFTSHVTTQGGGTLRIGGAGLSTVGVVNDLNLIENFQAYSHGTLSSGVTGGKWSSVSSGTDGSTITSVAANKWLEFSGNSNTWRGAQTSLRSSFAPEDYALDQGEQATYFFRVQRQGTQSIDGVFGLTDLDSIGTGTPWNELAVTLSFFQGTAAGDTTTLRAYDGGGGGDVPILSNIAAGQWINIWLMVNNQNKTFQVATSTGASGGTLFANTFEFGRSTASGAALDTFAGSENRGIPGTRFPSKVGIDDLYYLEGSSLINPLALAGETLTIEGDLALTDPTATLRLDIAQPTLHDRLVVEGTAALAGILKLDLAAGFTLAVGNTFDLFDFGTTSGNFDQFDLPTLGANLRWNVSSLAANGTLSVVAGLDGDFNADGVVDAADYTVWRDSLGRLEDAVLLGGNGSETGLVDEADYNLWLANFGTTLASASQLQSVPEPASLALLAISVACLYKVRPQRVIPAQAVI